MQGEANDIMGWAAERELTGTNFVWEQLDKHFFIHRLQNLDFRFILR